MDNNDKQSLFQMFAEEMEELKKLKIPDIVIAQAEARAAKEETKSVASRAAAFYDLISIFVLPEAMEDQGIEGLKVADIGRVNLRPDMWCSTKKEMGPELMQWLRDNDHEDLIKDNVNPSTLKAFVKEQKLKGNPIPGDDILSVLPYTRAVITKS